MKSLQINIFSGVKLIYSCIFLFAICLHLGSCTQIEVFEKNTSIPQFRWHQNFSANGDFIIQDTLSAYNIYIVLRHTDAYPYNNIWLNVGLQAPGDSLYKQKVNLALGDDLHGWDGNGMNDIWEVRKLLNGRPRRFKHAGKYSFQIAQIMRDNPLPQVLSVGLRIEKVKY